MQTKTIPLTILISFLGHIFSTATLAGSNGELEGRVVRSRDSEPIPYADVRVEEKKAHTTFDALG